MDTEDLTLFLDVAAAGSFVGAARQRDLDPSLVSRTIARLETRLGARLFHRTTRSLSLTDAGERFAPRARQLIEDVESAEAAIRQGAETVAGTVRLTASVAFAEKIVVPALPCLLACHPDLRVQLIASDSNLDLAAQGIDLAIRLAPRPEGPYVVSRLCRTRYRVVAAPDWVNRHLVTHPDDLRDLPCLCPYVPDFRSHWRFRNSAGEDTTVPVSGAVEASALNLLTLAEHGMGPALLPDWLVDTALASKTLVHILPEFEVTATDFETSAWLLYPSRLHLPLKTRTVIDHLRETVGKRHR